VALGVLFLDKEKTARPYALDSKTMNIMNNMMVITMSISTRSAEDDNLSIAWRDAESKISSIFLIPLLRRCLFLFNRS
jgi:hypothetical protein